MWPQFLWLNVVKTDQNMLNPHLAPSPHPSGAPGALKSPRLSLSSVSWPSTAGRSKWSKTADSGGFWSYLHMVKIANHENFRATTKLTFDLYNLGMCQNSTPTLHGSTSADPLQQSQFSEICNMSDQILSETSIRSTFVSSPCSSHVLCLRDRATLARVLLAWTCGRLGWL